MENELFYVLWDLIVLEALHSYKKKILKLAIFSALLYLLWLHIEVNCFAPLIGVDVLGRGAVDIDFLPN